MADSLRLGVSARHFISGKESVSAAERLCCFEKELSRRDAEAQRKGGAAHSKFAQRAKLLIVCSTDATDKMRRFEIQFSMLQNGVKSTSIDSPFGCSRGCGSAGPALGFPALRPNPATRRWAERLFCLEQELSRGGAEEGRKKGRAGVGTTDPVARKCEARTCLTIPDAANAWQCISRGVSPQCSCSV